MAYEAETPPEILQTFPTTGCGRQYSFADLQLWPNF